MEYITYILIILGIIAVCFILLPERVQDNSLGKRAPKSDISAETPTVDVVASNNMRSVPVPWGWPGHAEHTTDKSHASLNASEVHGVSESLHRFADRLLSEKQTVENGEYVLKKDASIKALLEDRYGRVRKKTRPSPVRAKPPVKEGLREIKTPWGW